MEKPTLPTKEEERMARRGLNWVFILVGCLVVGLLVLLGVGLVNNQRGILQPGDHAPTFILQLYNGDSIKLSDIKGKLILVNFWASWCDSCKDEADWLQKARQKYQTPGSVVFIGVDYDDTEKEANGYLHTFKITYPNGPDLQSRISNQYNVSGVPETYIIGTDGKIADVQIGPFNSYEDLINKLDGLLAGMIH